MSQQFCSCGFCSHGIRQLRCSGYKLVGLPACARPVGDWAVPWERPARAETDQCSGPAWSDPNWDEAVVSDGILGVLGGEVRMGVQLWMWNACEGNLGAGCWKDGAAVQGAELCEPLEGGRVQVLVWSWFRSGHRWHCRAARL